MAKIKRPCLEHFEGISTTGDVVQVKLGSAVDEQETTVPESGSGSGGSPLPFGGNPFGQIVCVDFGGPRELAVGLALFACMPTTLSSGVILVGEALVKDGDPTAAVAAMTGVGA